MVQEHNPEEHHHEVGSAAEKQLTIFTLWYISIKYDENRLRAMPEKSDARNRKAGWSK